MSLLAPVPGLRLAAPRDAETLREELAEALDVDDAPTVVRFSKGAAPERVPALERLGGPHGVDVLARTGEVASGGADAARSPARDVLVVAVGAFAPLALDVADRLAAHGISATVVDPRWVLPVPSAVVDLAREHRLVLTVEDGVRTGGVGSCTTQALADAGLEVPVSVVGVPVRFWEHGTRAQVLAAAGLTAQDIARGVAERVAGLPPVDRAGEQTGERSGAPLAERS
jgi:1-deoxy-D-xylulose-5-phosphate synthase